MFSYYVIDVCAVPTFKVDVSKTEQLLLFNFYYTIIIYYLFLLLFNFLYNFVIFTYTIYIPSDMGDLKKKLYYYDRVWVNVHNDITNIRLFAKKTMVFFLFHNI